MKNSILFLLVLFFLVACEKPKSTEKEPVNTQASGEIDRTILPIKEPLAQTYTELDVRNAKLPPRFEVKAPARSTQYNLSAHR
ncbi:MAG: hypothetical protein U5K51_06580 [Flavobacteriaceae bacterium]|nr:hypothetical protein [Flavobacteriaceae bacterium]